MTGPVAAKADPGRRTDGSVLAVLLLASTLTVMAGAVLVPVIELIRADLGLTSAAAGLILTAHGLSLALAGPLVGRAMDRWGVRGPLAAGLVLYGLAGAVGLVVSSYPVLIASRLVFGVGAAVVFTGATVGLLNLYEGAARDRAMGWRSTAISLGGICFPMVGGALGAISWHAPFAVYLLGVPLGLAVLWLLPATTAGPPGGAGAALGRLFSFPRQVLVLCGLQFVASGLLYGVLVFLPLRLAEVGITRPFTVALFTATMSLVMSLVGLGYARLRAWLGNPRLVIVSFATWTVALATLAVTDVPALLLVAPAVFGIGMGVAVPAMTLLVAEHVPPNRRGQATALLATATFTGQFVSPLLLGPVQSATSVPATFATCAALAGVVLVALLVTHRRGSADDVPGVGKAG
ncbi:MULTISPECIES: MFS transporter [Micromonospora]|uniref:Predicted arabinose efflux permease, MFS family n=1 Tax=Micromonospora yangpuensis TaxID=683228 RepID=A0A1C6UNK4_9ACTN|nr:MFS transporter [Micromonospora yangpuensis]GGM09183.1 MFS transporter [Micromonospora yangpuensis]SCL55594.1 Predicted arabinose efflux permease, MFS family [Micromonospora yangpuensis]